MTIAIMWFFKKLFIASPSFFMPGPDMKSKKGERARRMERMKGSARFAAPSGGEGRLAPRSDNPGPLPAFEWTTQSVVYDSFHFYRRHHFSEKGSL
jgi:hypothetical protein